VCDRILKEAAVDRYYLSEKFAGGAGERRVNLQTLHKGGRSDKLHL
jgi:hypothetical protein